MPVTNETLAQCQNRIMRNHSHDLLGMSTSNGKLSYDAQARTMINKYLTDQFGENHGFEVANDEGIVYQARQSGGDIAEFTVKPYQCVDGQLTTLKRSAWLVMAQYEGIGEMLVRFT